MGTKSSVCMHQDSSSRYIALLLLLMLILLPRIADACYFCLSTDEAYDSGVTAGSDGTCEGQECTPASGAQGTVKLKVSNPVRKGTKRSNTSNSTHAKAPEGGPCYKMQLLECKLKHDRLRQDAAFAAKLLKNPSLSHIITSQAEDIVMAFLAKAKGGSREDSVSSPSDENLDM